ncbi:MAG: AAA family ATPase [Clostridia bacterium]|nr:AAA family ATPase [Clostridia bacterium]
MEYRSIKGDFGAFSGELNFKSGLNTVFAENESGKSTFCAFLSAMLYGINTSERERSDKLPDKIKYQPWSGRPMNGRLSVLSNGNEILLSRSSIHGPLRDFTATYALSGETVPDINGSNAGQVLLGLEQDVFEKTALCSAENLAVKNSEALEARISAAVSSGEDEVSHSSAKARLAAWARERKNGKRGMIPELEARIASAQSALAQTEEKNGEIIALAAEIKTLKSKKLVLENELSAIADRQKNRLVAEDLRQQYKLLCGETEAFANENRLYGPRADINKVSAAEVALRTVGGLEADLQVAKSELYRMKAEYASAEVPEELSVFENCSPEYAISVADKARKRYAKLLSAGPKYWLFLISAACLAAGIIIHVLSDPTAPAADFPAYVCFAAALITTVLGITGTVNAVKRKREAKNMLARWGCRSPEQFRDIARGYEHFCRSKQNLAESIRSAEDAVSALEDKLRFAQSGAKQYVFELGLDKTDPKRDAAVLLSRLSELERMVKKCEKAEAALMVYDEPDTESDEMLSPAYERLCQALREKELSLERKLGEQSALGSADGICAEIAKAGEELSARNREYEAILAAAELLERVGEEFSREMTPKIASRAEEIFTRLTHGRYGELNLTRNLEVSAVQTGEAVARKLLSLSRGASDQAWLSVRLALGEALGAKETPLILDDVFAMYDDNRAETAIEFLSEEAKNRQIILLTCRNRDALLTEKYGGNLVRLQN